MHKTTRTMEESKYEYTQRLLGLLKIESKLCSTFRDAINNLARDFLEENDLLADEASSFISLFLDDKKHTEDDVKALVRAVPSVLFDEDKVFGLLPITAVAMRWLEDCDADVEVQSHALIPILAQEGARLNVGGPDGRGGLLYVDEYENVPNVFKLLCEYASVKHSVSIFKRLMEMGLFKKEDIRKHDLFYYACTKKPHDGDSSDLFEYFIELDSEVIKDGRINGTHLITAITNEPNFFDGDDVYLALKAGLKHFPNHLGFLYEKNLDGINAWELASRDIDFDSEDMWSILKRCIKETGNDKIFEDKDRADTFTSIFAAAASNITPDFNIVYHLLRKDPSEWLINCCREYDGNNKRCSIGSSMPKEVALKKSRTSF